MKKQPKLLRYLLRDKVDFILLLITISFLIAGMKTFNSRNPNDFTVAWLGVFILYIIGVTIRTGTSMDIIDKYVYDPLVREELGLNRIMGVTYKPKSTVFAKIVDVLFWAALIGGLTYFTITY